jgi:2-oxo-4-hydroxy-4-carboxy-5-ureidoimidazoline decarboxylase
MNVPSAAEQSSAGLDRLTDEEYARFARLNTAYREKFGFPFIIAVRKARPGGDSRHLRSARRVSDH